MVDTISLCILTVDIMPLHLVIMDITGIINGYLLYYVMPINHFIIIAILLSRDTSNRKLVSKQTHIVVYDVYRLLPTKRNIQIISFRCYPSRNNMFLKSGSFR